MQQGGFFLRYYNGVSLERTMDALKLQDITLHVFPKAGSLLWRGAILSVACYLTL